jgi:hypothetical protein
VRQEIECDLVLDIFRAESGQSRKTVVYVTKNELTAKYFDQEERRLYQLQGAINALVTDLSFDFHRFRLEFSSSRQSNMLTA